MHRYLLTALLLIVTPQFLGTTCEGPPPATPLLTIDTPADGTFTTGSTVVVTGSARRGEGAIQALTVNGVDVLPLTGHPQDGTWSVVLPLDPGVIFNEVFAEMTLGNFFGGSKVRERITIIAGDGVTSGFILDGSKSPESIALRLNDTGLDEVEPVITGLVNLDLATLVPVGTQVVNEFCYADIFGACIGTADAFVEQNPSAPPTSPSVSSFAIGIDSQTNQVDGLVTLSDLYVRARVEDGNLGIGFTCHVDMTATISTIDADYALDPDAVDPSLIDVTQLGGVIVSFGNFNDSTDCDGFLGGLVELFVGAFVGSFETLLGNGLATFLNTTDPQGNTPIAGAIEMALEDVDIAGPIGDALGATLDTALFSVDEDTAGITLGSDGAFIASPVPSGTCYDDVTGMEIPGPVFCDPDTPCVVGQSCRGLPGECVAPASAPDYPASYHVAEAFPTFGATTPAPSSLPYDMSLAVGSSAFNQLLKAQLECGLLSLSVTELPVIGNLSGAILSVLIPEIAIYPLTNQYKLIVDPTTSAIVTGDTGPMGELDTLRVHGLEVTLRDVNESLPILLKVSVDAIFGLDASFDMGALAFSLGTPDPQNDLELTFLVNRLGADEASLETVVSDLLVLAAPFLSDALEAFPLPQFLGLQLSDVEVGRAGEFLSLYLDLSPAP